ncbi:hypothetical protein [Dactylococcopsis salina]|nr:hypothetical protein [Dactylococcopsis salina]
MKGNATQQQYSLFVICYLFTGHWSLVTDHCFGLIYYWFSCKITESDYLF